MIIPADANSLDSKPETIQDIRQGQGTCKYDDGSSYKGSWHMDKRNGSGVLTERDGSRYDGQWKNDKKHGKGV